MKKASLVFAALAYLALSQINVCFSQSTTGGHWQLIQGDPFPDSVTQIVAGPGSLVYMATSDNGVFKSTDEGENWTQINTGLNGDLDITMLALGPKGDLLARNKVGDILYSKDASTWTNDGIPWLSQFPSASATAFAFDVNGDPFVGTLGAGIYKMDSIGKWGQVFSLALIPGAQAMLFDNQNRLVVHYDKLYRLKSDFSAIDTSWTISNIRNSHAQLLRTTGGSILVVSDTLYELTDQLRIIIPNGEEKIVADSTGNLYSYNGDYFPEQSTDHGTTWHGVAGNNQYVTDFLEAGSYGFIGFRLDYPAVNISYDTDKTFSLIRPLNTRLSINEIDVDNTGTIQAFEKDGGIWSSSDRGNSWHRRMSKQCFVGSLLEDGKYYATMHYSSQTLETKRLWPPMVSIDGVNYRPLNVPPGVEGILSVCPNGELWLSYGQAHFMRSLNGGATWNEFAHFTDSGAAYAGGDSAWASGVIERGPYIWLATSMAIHLTSDDGATWQVDTPHYAFWGITGGKGNTLITHTSDEGIHWLNPGEDPDSGWLALDGSFVENLDGTMLQVQMKDDRHWFISGEQALFRLSKSGTLLGTVCVIPDSLSFGYEQMNNPQMAIDSEGDIFAAIGYDNQPPTGLYHFVPASSSVTQQVLSSGDLNVSVTNNVITISSSNEIQSADMLDVTGRLLITIPAAHSTTLSASVASVPNGVYLVKAETAGGTTVRKVAIIR